MTDLSFSEPLSEEQTKALIDSFLSSDKVGDEIIRAYLDATSKRLITKEELTGAVNSLREHMLKLEIPNSLLEAGILDTCGTGGSGLHTFNTSTASAFVCAAAGQAVAKHGNRAATSLSGSADVIEELGISLDLNPEQLVDCLRQTNFCFMFAPKHHASTKRVAVQRKQLGKRTIFNFIGPLCNPAQASYQVLGVSDLKMLEIIASSLPRLKVKKALVVRGEDGLDEISITSSTRVFEVSGTKIESYNISPEDFGLKRLKLEEIQGLDAKGSAMVMREVLAGKNNAYCELVALNAGAGIYISGRSDTLNSGVQRAREILNSGAALAVLDKVVSFCK